MSPLRRNAPPQPEDAVREQSVLRANRSRMRKLVVVAGEER